MSKVYQCDKCGRIFEPRVLQNGEPYIARKGKTDLDLCPECYGYLMNFLKEDIDECKCSTCKYMGVSTTRKPCRECCHAWDDMYEEAENIATNAEEADNAEEGEWIDDKCSACGKGIEDLIDSREWYQNEDPNYCPFCGIKIRHHKAESET